MTYRHLLIHAHELIDRPLHLAHTTAKHSGGLILGLPLQTFIMLAAAAAVGITVICILFVAYRRRRTLVDYNDSPEQFPNLPPLSYKESKNLKKREVKTLIKGDEEVQVDKSNDINGPFYKIVFKGNKPQAVIFDYMQ